MYSESINCYKAETSTTRLQGYFFSTALLISGFQDIAADPVVEISPGLMGYFSIAKIKYIKSLFAIIGKADPLGKVINPLWAALQEQIREEYLRYLSPYSLLPA